MSQVFGFAPNLFQECPHVLGMHACALRTDWRVGLLFQTQFREQNVPKSGPVRDVEAVRPLNFVGQFEHLYVVTVLLFFFRHQVHLVVFQKASFLHHNKLLDQICQLLFKEDINPVDLCEKLMEPVQHSFLGRNLKVSFIYTWLQKANIFFSYCR